MGLASGINSYNASRGIRLTYVFRTTPLCVLATFAFLLLTGDAFGDFTFEALLAFFGVISLLNVLHILKIAMMVDEANKVLYIRNYLRFRKIDFDSIEGYRVISSVMGSRTNGPVQNSAGLPVLYYKPNRHVDVSAALITEDNLRTVQSFLDLMKRLEIALV